MVGTRALAKGNAAPSSPVDPEQALKASKALLAHIKKARSESTSKRSLLDAGGDEEGGSLAETPVWLTLTTKRNVADSNRLQPHTIALPHPLNSDSETTVCVITADPQRAYKDIVASDEFPADLRGKITRVIGFSKLQAKFRQYEAQRLLYSQHDVFVADDRIVSRLPKALGKTFFKTTTKRPIAAAFQKPRAKVAGKRLKREKGKDEINARPAREIAAEIQKALDSALVALSPSTNTAVKIGYATWDAAHLAANAEAVAKTLVEKYVPQKWDNVRAIYLKGPQTTALPIWQTPQLWVNDKDILHEGSEEWKAIEEKKEKANVGKKRKALDGPGEAPTGGKTKKARNTKLPESHDEDLDRRISDHKAKLRKQKKAARAAMQD